MGLLGRKNNPVTITLKCNPNVAILTYQPSPQTPKTTTQTLCQEVLFPPSSSDITSIFLNAAGAIPLKHQSHHTTCRLQLAMHLQHLEALVTGSAAPLSAPPSPIQSVGHPTAAKLPTLSYLLWFPPNTLFF